MAKIDFDYVLGFRLGGGGGGGNDNSISGNTVLRTTRIKSLVFHCMKKQQQSVGLLGLFVGK